jgi:PAS domain-containing protein
VKADKIYEHHQRLNQLINLLSEIVLIVTVNGDIVYINEVFRKRFPTITDTGNLNEVIQKDDFNARIFDMINKSLRFGDNIYDETVQIEGSSQTALIKGSVIRNRKGVASGGVYTVEIIGEPAQN